MKYFVCFSLLVLSSLTNGMDPDFMFTADDFISATEFKRRLDERVQQKIKEHRENLPSYLRDGLPDHEYDSEDYEDVKTPEGLRRYEEASEAFERDGPTAPVYVYSELIHRERREARLVRQATHHTELTAEEHREMAFQQNSHSADVGKSLSEESDETGSSSSYSDEEAPTVMDWDVVEGVTKEAKQKPNPTDWMLNIDWASLETSPAVSPSKKASVNPLIKSLRVANWRRLGSLPHYGWIPNGKRYLGVGGKCDLCNRPLQHGHILSHQEVEGVEICVGRICASHLQKDQDTIEREREARLASEPALSALITAIQSLSVQ